MLYICIYVLEVKDDQDDQGVTTSPGNRPNCLVDLPSLPDDLKSETPI
jgi:hypothetical protein